MQQIKNEQKRNQRLIDLTTLPENSKKAGTLTLSRRGQRQYCYEEWYEQGKRVRKQYLGTPNSQPVQHLVQNRLKRERLHRLWDNRKLLAKFQAGYRSCDTRDILDDLPKAYREVARQYETSFDARYERVKQWASEEHRHNAAPFPDAAIYAKDGTRVRSKGECIIYNLLQESGVLFLYDTCMTFTDARGKTHEFCPDFVIQCLDGRWIIIEHLGWLHDLKYAQVFGEKCHWYIQSGFILGRNFFVTSDDADGGTDSQAILEVVHKVERMFYGY